MLIIIRKGTFCWKPHLNWTGCIRHWISYDVEYITFSSIVIKQLVEKLSALIESISKWSTIEFEIKWRKWLWIDPQYLVIGHYTIIWVLKGYPLPCPPPPKKNVKLLHCCQNVQYRNGEPITFSTIAHAYTLFTSFNWQKKMFVFTISTMLFHFF